jgi:uncharacterized protein (DUF1501 family)
MHIKRRSFLQIGSLATANLMLPKFLQAFNEQSFTPVPAGNKVLVVLQFSGGNDGLNTIIPITNDIYYRERPKLGIQKEKAIALTTDAGIHPELKAFADLFNDGHLGILNSVGYSNPDRSHFRSMDIWHTASNSSDYLNSGWLGRYLDNQCKNCDKPTQALEIDDVLSLALKGEHAKGLALKDPQRLLNSSNSAYFKQLSQQHQHHHEHETVDYLYKTLTETVNSAQYIYQQSKLKPSKASYPKTDLGNSFKTIASLIFSDINTKVYYVSVGSFDTHVNQQAQQARLFKEINDAVAAFVADLKLNNRFEDILLMTFSEFGRRVGQNASGGTDHGTANNMFFAGGGLQQKGLLNELPNLSNLKDGDLQHTVDFKEVYATILNKWLQVNDTAILGKQYQHLSFI